MASCQTVSKFRHELSDWLVELNLGLLPMQRIQMPKYLTSWFQAHHHRPLGYTTGLPLLCALNHGDNHRSRYETSRNRISLQYTHLHRYRQLCYSTSNAFQLGILRSRIRDLILLSDLRVQSTWNACRLLRILPQ